MKKNRREELIPLDPSDYVYFLMVEGGAEEAIVSLLLENQILIFKPEDLFQERILRRVSARKFEEQYLKSSFGKKKGILIRVIDSKTEGFKLSRYNKDRVRVVDVLTRPEIEILMIHREGKFEDYQRWRNNHKKLAESQPTTVKRF